MAEWFKALCLGLFLNRSGSESSQHHINHKMIANPLQNLVGSNPTPLMSPGRPVSGQAGFFFGLGGVGARKEVDLLERM